MPIRFVGGGEDEPLSNANEGKVLELRNLSGFSNIVLTLSLSVVPNGGMVEAGTSAQPTPGADAAVEAALREWRTDLLVRLGYSDLHVKKSLKAVEAFSEFVGNGAKAPRLADLTRTAILRWATSLISADRPGSRKTAQNHVSQLRSFCDFLVLRGDLDTNPADRLRMPSARGRRAGAVHFTAAEVSALILAAETRERPRRVRGPLASTFYGFLAMTGLRYGEAGSQRWDDVNLDEGWIILTKDKARRNDRLPLTREAVAALRIWRAFSPGALVFPNRPSHHTLVEDMEACGIAGATEGVKGQWHRFRKCAVRERAKAGASVRDLKHFARHADVNQTLNFYDAAGVEELRSAAELMPRLNGFLDRGEKIQPEKSVDKPGGSRLDERVETLDTGMSDNLPTSESHAGAREGCIPPGLDHLAVSPPRAPAQDSDCQWSRGESPSRLDGRLNTINKALDIAAEALRQLRGPAAVLFLAACVAKPAARAPEPAPQPTQQVADQDRPAPSTDAKPELCRSPRKP